MTMEKLPYGYRWRSSRPFLIFVVMFSLFCEKVQYGFIVPILKYMVEDRLHLDPSHTQNITTALLAAHGLSSTVAAPIIAHFADRTPNRKYILVSSLLGCILGVTLIAWTPSLWVLFLGRIIQAIAGCATWIAAFAMLVDNTPPERTGFWLNLTMSMVTVAFIAGPAISGSVLQVANYWTAWSVPLALLFLNAISRLLMIDKKRDVSSTKSTQDPRETREAEESQPILSDSGAQDYSGQKSSEIAKQRIEDGSSVEPPHAEESSVRPVSSSGFYKNILPNPRFHIGLSNILLEAIIITGFDATLPLYLINEFHWGTLPVGFMFFVLQGPTILLGPIMGVIQDRYGLRIPTVVGWLLVMLFLWLLGCPANSAFHWTQPHSKGEAIVITSVVGVGLGMLGIMGAGCFQLIAVVSELEANNPGVFGVHGANSRVSALMEVCFNFGSFVGPLISGGLVELLNYYDMNCIIAGLALLNAILSGIYLNKRKKK